MSLDKAVIHSIAPFGHRGGWEVGSAFEARDGGNAICSFIHA
jgi:hypothetical protein